MKRFFVLLITSVLLLPGLQAQSFSNIEGTCGQDVKWVFDGYKLTISNVSKTGSPVSMADYDLQVKKAPWVKKNLNVRKVQVGMGIDQIGSCAFANCQNLQEVVFEGTFMRKIGWGAFLNCSHLRNISLPVQLRSIGTVAFANCTQLPSVKIPDQCRVDDQAFACCDNLQSVEISPTAILGHQVFAGEVTVNKVLRHTLYNKEIRRLPSYVNLGNCREYGFSKSSVERIIGQNRGNDEDYDYQTSDVDKKIPTMSYSRNNTYALIFGNQNYRFVSDVPYAIHDARVFAEYCKKTLGLPVENVHISEDATKQMMMEEELEDWIQSIPERENKKLIVYYAGHGVPDVKNKNKAYILPTDVRGTNPSRGIALDEFYSKLGDYAFAQTTVFLDACFSGVNRDNEGVSEGLRGVEIVAEDTQLGGGSSIVVFSAAQGNETAQGYPEEGHGLFTYYLLKELQESYGNVEFGILADHLNKNVSKTALELKLRKKQTPVANTSEGLSNNWRGMGF